MLPRRILPALTLAALAAACSPPRPDVRVDYDHDTDFSRFRTFGWVTPSGTDRSGYTTLTTERIKAAAEREMLARGYTFTTNNPDLLVNFQAKLQQRMRVEPGALPPGGYYAYRAYGVWLGYGFGSTAYVEQYTEGTLNIDLVDRARNRLVWEGVAVGRVTPQVRSDPTRAIDDAVSAIFAEYPFTAGRNVPSPQRN